MPSHIDALGDTQNLRSRALLQLDPRSSSANSRSDAAAALGVLHQWASSPSTASDALTLLHELQVHQVELEMQAEELRSSRIAMEAELQRHVQLYDFAPVGYFTVDQNTTLCELNATGARLLGAECDALLGRCLDSFLTAPAADMLHTLLARVNEGHVGEVCSLQLAAGGDEARRLSASACADPAGRGFLIAIFPSAGSV
ncbi:MAG: PAS domain-containing protein [Rhizobacter sp.]|nr:PAS domain-containing protein [Rhizobacter sp.]